MTPAPIPPSVGLLPPAAAPARGSSDEPQGATDRRRDFSANGWKTPTNGFAAWISGWATDDRGPFAGSLRQATLRLGVTYWALVFVTSSILWGVVGVDPVESAFGKLALITLSALMTFAMTAVLFRLRSLSFLQKAALSFLLAGAAGPLYCLGDYAIYTICVYPEPPVFSLNDYGYTLVYGTSLFFGWACLFVALLYSFEVRDRERRLAAVREEALTSQMRALRYQISPHFLFNTLNSVAGLIEEGAATRAERMVLALSTFLRTTLTLDPMQDVRLADELALQEEYLEIERERFSDRMTLTLDLDEGVGEVLVPSLILQPLVENALKHGVGATTGRVAIAITARRSAERLLLTIENDMPDANERQGRRPVGTGIGLRNVSERIAARFQDNGSLTFGPVGPRRYRAALDLPWRLA